MNAMSDISVSGEKVPPYHMFYINGEPEEARLARHLILDAFCDLEFYERNHVYILNGECLPSVSSIGSRFESKPFDKFSQAARYAERHGNTLEYWIEQWERNSFRATSLGTKTHEFGESLAYLKAGHAEFIRPSVSRQFLESCSYLAPIHPKEEAVERFLVEMPESFHLVINEARVYSGKNPNPSLNLRERVCGTFDMLYYYDGEGHPERAGYVLFDYKTNRDLYSEFNQRNHIMLLPPFDDFFQESYGEYAIQLSLYALMLEDIGLNVLDRRVVWLKDNGTYECLSLPDLSARLRAVI